MQNLAQVHIHTFRDFLRFFFSSSDMWNSFTLDILRTWWIWNVTKWYWGLMRLSNNHGLTKNTKPINTALTPLSLQSTALWITPPPLPPTHTPINSTSHVTCHHMEQEGVYQLLFLPQSLLHFLARRADTLLQLAGHLQHRLVCHRQDYRTEETANRGTQDWQLGAFFFLDILIIGLWPSW